MGGLAVASARAQSALGTSALPSPPNMQAAKLYDTVGNGFNRIVIARWGDGVLPNAPPFNPNPLTGEQADSQFPYDGVIAALINPPPAQDGIPRKVLVVATPDVPARMVFPGGVDNPDVAGREQGITIINLQYLGGRWATVDGGYQSRRIADGTLCQMSGPAAAALGGTVQGVLAPQGGCATPWGNVLLGEGDAGPWLTRLAGVGYGYADPAQAPRFGWVVDLNPLNPLDIPIKRTALGRISRSGLVATQTKDGRPVVFFTQDDPAGFLFRFIAATNATDGTALDFGDDLGSAGPEQRHKLGGSRDRCANPGRARGCRGPGGRLAVRCSRWPCADSGRRHTLPRLPRQCRAHPGGRAQPPRRG